MNNLELIGWVLLGAMSAILGAAAICKFIWIVVDRCEDFSKSPWEEMN